MAKKIDGYIKLQIPAGQANPSPPVGPALGQAGLNILEFCKAFNGDKTFSFISKSPPASYFIKRAARLEKGSETPGQEPVGIVTMNQLREIAEKKKEDLNANDVDAACRILAGTARSMGITGEGQ